MTRANVSRKTSLIKLSDSGRRRRRDFGCLVEFLHGAASGHAAAAPPSNVMNRASSLDHLVGAGDARVGRPLLCGGLRRRLPRDEFPAVRRFCPGVEEHEPQAARLAVDLRLDRRAAGDECGVAREAHLAIAAGRALDSSFPSAAR
jgi:hypothetical protein